MVEAQRGWSFSTAMHAHMASTSGTQDVDQVRGFGALAKVFRQQQVIKHRMKGADRADGRKERFRVVKRPAKRGDGFSFHPGGAFRRSSRTLGCSSVHPGR